YEVAARGHGDSVDLLQPVGKGRVGFAELGSIRPCAGRGEPHLVPVWSAVGRRHAIKAINAVDISENRLQLDAITKQRDRPALQTRLVDVGYLVEVGVEPGGAVQSADAGDSSDSDRDAGARGLWWGVPCYDPGVRERRTGGKSRGNLRPEAHVDGLSGLQGPVHSSVVRGQQRAHNGDTRRGAVHRWCWVDEREPPRTGCAQ